MIIGQTSFSYIFSTMQNLFMKGNKLTDEYNSRDLLVKELEEKYKLNKGLVEKIEYFFQ
jgi:hypothetical protein